MSKRKYFLGKIERECLSLLPKIPIQERYAYNVFIHIFRENKIPANHTNVYQALRNLEKKGILTTQPIPWAGSGRFKHLKIYHFTFKGEMLFDSEGNLREERLAEILTEEPSPCTSKTF
jgi:DNA-binding PadR family transcriptional regulator